MINIFCCISEPKITNTFSPFRQIEVTRSLLDTYPYLDRSRVGIWGWSYGGYSTLRILQRDEDEVFQCGAIVAPPTNWLFYDSVYTERYMALPTEGDNQAGYDRGSVLAEEEVGGMKFATQSVDSTSQTFICAENEWGDGGLKETFCRIHLPASLFIHWEGIADKQDDI